MSETDQSDELFDDGALHGASVGDDERLVLDIAGYEGPLDLLLTLARAQKVDLAQISILELVEQYLAFISEIRRLRLELAADYLVMAAWLAYLKSRLLLPAGEEDEELSGEELALRLQLQLQRLHAMREAAARLMARDRMGRDVFARGAPEGWKISRQTAYDVTLFELLKAYAVRRATHDNRIFHIERRALFSLEEAIHRLESLIGTAVNWTQLAEFLPGASAEPFYQRSAVASTFAASLELAREGKADIRQLEAFGPVYVRRRLDKASDSEAG